MDLLKVYLEEEKNLKLQPNVIMLQSRLHWLMLSQMRKFVGEASKETLLDFIFENAYDNNEWDSSLVSDFFSKLYNTLGTLIDKDKEAQLFLLLLTNRNQKGDIQLLQDIFGFVSEFKNIPVSECGTLNRYVLSLSEIAILKRNFPIFDKLTAKETGNEDGISLSELLLNLFKNEEICRAFSTQLGDTAAVKKTLRQAKLRRSLLTVKVLVRMLRGINEGKFYKEKLLWTERLAELTALVTSMKSSEEDSFIDLKTDLIRHFSDGKYTNISSLSNGLNEALLSARDEFVHFVQHIDKQHLSHIYQLIELKERSDLKRLRVELEALEVNHSNLKSATQRMTALAKDLLYFHHFKRCVSARVIKEKVEVGAKFERNEGLDKHVIVFLKKTEFEIQKAFSKLVERREADLNEMFEKLKRTQFMDDFYDFFKGKAHQIDSQTRMSNLLGGDRKSKRATQRFSKRDVENEGGRGARAVSTGVMNMSTMDRYSTKQLFNGWNYQLMNRSLVGDVGEDVSQAILNYAGRISVAGLVTVETEASFESYLQKVLGKESDEFFGVTGAPSEETSANAVFQADEVLIKKQTASYLEIAYSDLLSTGKKESVSKLPSLGENDAFRKESSSYLDLAYKEMLPEVGKPDVRNSRSSLPSERPSVVRKHPSVYQSMSVYEETQKLVQIEESIQPVKTSVKKEVKGLLDSIYKTSLEKIGSSEGLPTPAPSFTFQPKKYTAQTTQNGGNESEVRAPQLKVNLRGSIAKAAEQSPEFAIHLSRSSQINGLPAVPNVDIRTSISDDKKRDSLVRFADGKYANAIPDAPALSYEDSSPVRRTLQGNDQLDLTASLTASNFKKHRGVPETQFVQIDSKPTAFQPKMNPPILNMEKVISGHIKKQATVSFVDDIPAPIINMSSALRTVDEASNVARLSGSRNSLRQPDIVDAPNITGRQSLFKSELSGSNLPNINVSKRESRVDDLSAPYLNLSIATGVNRTVKKSEPGFSFVPRSSLISPDVSQQMPFIGNPRASLQIHAVGESDVPVLLKPIKVGVSDDFEAAPAVDMNFLAKIRDSVKNAPAIVNFRPSLIGSQRINAPNLNLNYKQENSQPIAAPRMNISIDAQKYRNSFQVDVMELPPQLNLDFSKSRASLAGRAAVETADPLPAPRFEYHVRQSLTRKELDAPEQAQLPKISLGFGAQRIVRAVDQGTVQTQSETSSETGENQIFSTATNQTTTYIIETINAPNNAVPSAPAIDFDNRKYSAAEIKAPDFNVKLRQSLTMADRSAPSLSLRNLPKQQETAVSSAVPEISFKKVRQSQVQQQSITESAPIVNLSRIHNAKRNADDKTSEEPPHFIANVRQSLMGSGAVSQPVTTSEPRQSVMIPDAPIFEPKYRAVEHPEMFSEDTPIAPHLLEIKSFHRSTLSQLKKHSVTQANETDDFTMTEIPKDIVEEMRRSQCQGNDLLETSTAFLNIETQNQTSIPQLQSQGGYEDETPEAPVFNLVFKKVPNAQPEEEVIDAPVFDFKPKLPEADDEQTAPEIKLNLESYKLKTDKVAVPVVSLKSIHNAQASELEAPLLTEGVHIRSSLVGNRANIPLVPLPMDFLKHYNGRTEDGQTSEVSDTNSQENASVNSSAFVNKLRIGNKVNPDIALAPKIQIHKSIMKVDTELSAPALNLKATQTNKEMPNVAVIDSLVNRTSVKGELRAPENIKRGTLTMAQSDNSNDVPLLKKPIRASLIRSDNTDVPILDLSGVKRQSMTTQIEGPSAPVIEMSRASIFGSQTLNPPVGVFLKNKNVPNIIDSAPSLPDQAIRYIASGEQSAPQIDMSFTRRSTATSQQVIEGPTITFDPTRYSLTGERRLESPSIALKPFKGVSKLVVAPTQSHPPSLSLRSSLYRPAPQSDEPIPMDPFEFYKKLSYSVPGMLIPGLEEDEPLPPAPKDVTVAQIESALPEMNLKVRKSLIENAFKIIKKDQLPGAAAAIDKRQLLQGILEASHNTSKMFDGSAFKELPISDRKSELKSIVTQKSLKGDSKGKSTIVADIALSNGSGNSEGESSKFDVREFELQSNPIVKRMSMKVGNQLKLENVTSIGPAEQRTVVKRMSKASAKVGANDATFLKNCVCLSEQIRLSKRQRGTSLGRYVGNVSAKLKAVYWTPIEPVNFSASIWEQMTGFPQTIQFLKLGELFEDKQTNIDTIVQTPERLQYLSEKLKSVIHDRPGELQRAFKKLWTVDFTESESPFVQQCLALLPLTSESAAIADLGNKDLKSLNFASKWLIVASSIPNLEARLRGFILKSKFSEWSKTVSAKCESYSKIVKRILDDREFQKFLKACLDSGNMLNLNTGVGQANGFKIESIRALIACKSNKTVSLLEYLIYEFAIQDKSIVDALKALRDDAKHVRESPLAKLIEEVLEAKETLNLIRLAFEENDNESVKDAVFVSKFKRFYAKNAATVIDFEAQLTSLQERFEDAVYYLGEDSFSAERNVVDNGVLKALSESLEQALTVNI